MKNNDVKNNLGKFKILMKTKNNKELFEFEKLSQNELAEGWIQKLPKKSKHQPVHHFNISLAELPPYLFKYISIYSLLNNNIEFINIKNKIFLYSIEKSDHNLMIYNLYLQLNNKYKNNNKILELYNYCKDNDIYGWIMIKTKEYLEKKN